MSAELDLVRLGQYIAKRRRELDLSQDELARHGGPSNTKVSQLEQGKADAAAPAVLRKLDQSLKWEAGSARRIAEGGEPSVIGEPDFATVGDLSDPRYDPKHMARRIDELEETIADLRRRLESYEPADERTIAERDEDARAGDDALRRLVAEAAELGIAVSVYGDDYGFDYDTAAAALMPLAARRGQRSRAVTDQAQDGAGEENQDV